MRRAGAAETAMAEAVAAGMPVAAEMLAVTEMLAVEAITAEETRVVAAAVQAEIPEGAAMTATKAEAAAKMPGTLAAAPAHPEIPVRPAEKVG